MGTSNVEIKDTDKLVCPWCFKSHTVAEWNDGTYAKCINREMKRLFADLKDRSVYGKNSQKFYKCPNCEKWSRGNTLKFTDTEDKELLKLGGMPIMRIDRSGVWHNGQ